MKITFNKNTLILAVIFLAAFISACKKEAGQGGTSTITGRVHVYDYNGTFQTLNADYYGADESVYIIYGDGSTYDDNFKTSYDGSYKFQYLQEGKYKVYALSKDSTGKWNNTVNQNAPLKGVIQEIEITKGDQTVTVPDIVIFK